MSFKALYFFMKMLFKISLMILKYFIIRNLNESHFEHNYLIKIIIAKQFTNKSLNFLV